jgi:glycosyltransferase involved in cell wall biosynthesis
MTRSATGGFGVAPGKVSVVRNSPVLARFDPSRHPSRAFMEDGVLRLVYAGALTPTYELDVAIDAVARVAAARPALAIRFDVYGRGDSADALARRADELGLGGRVVFHGRIPLESVAAAVAATDVGLAPTRRDPFTDVSLSTKIYEYAAMRKPVVASRLPLVAQVFPLGTVMTYTPGDAADLAARILDCVDDPAAREAAVEATARLVAGASWERESVGYIDLVERLIDRS